MYYIFILFCTLRMRECDTHYLSYSCLMRGITIIALILALYISIHPDEFIYEFRNCSITVFSTFAKPFANFSNNIFSSHF